MKAKEGVLEFLNQVLRSELTAVHQYLLHAALCKNGDTSGCMSTTVTWRMKKCNTLPG